MQRHLCCHIEWYEAGTLAVDGWAVTFGTARRGHGEPQTTQAPPCCTKCNSPPINGQCTDHRIDGIYTLSVDGWAVTFGTARRGLGGLQLTLWAVPNVTAHPSTASVPALRFKCGHKRLEVFLEIFSYSFQSGEWKWYSGSLWWFMQRAVAVTDDICSAVAPMRGRGFGRGMGSNRGDMFRSRQPNTSRPPSMHVDDYIKMEMQGSSSSVQPPSIPPLSSQPRRLEVQQFCLVVNATSLISTWPYRRCNVGLVEGKYWRNCLCYSILCRCNGAQWYLLLVCVSWAITGQPQNSVFIRRVQPR